MLFNFRQTDIPGPAGSILTTAEDMGKWLEFLLKKGVNHEGTRLLDEGIFHFIFEEQMAGVSPLSDRDLIRPTFPVSDITAAYDLGWITSYYRGINIAW